MKKESIGIVIPLYNQGIYLEDALRSVYDNGTKFDVKVVIVDDKSTDNSLVAAESLSKTYRDAFTLISIQTHPVNRGLSAARNTGIQSIDTTYVVCLDADDRLHHNYFNQCWHTMYTQTADIVYTDMQEFGLSHALYTWHTFSEAELRRGNFIHCAAMFRKAVWETVGGFDVDMRCGLEDYEFWIRAHLCGFKFVKNLNTRLWWRRTASSMTAALETQNKRADVMAYIQNKHMGWFSGS